MRIFKVRFAVAEFIPYPFPLRQKLAHPVFRRGSFFNRLTHDVMSLSDQLNFVKHRVSHIYPRRLPRRLQSQTSHHSLGIALGQTLGMGVGCFEGVTNCWHWCCSTPRKACQRCSCSDSAAWTLSQRFS